MSLFETLPINAPAPPVSPLLPAVPAPPRMPAPPAMPVANPIAPPSSKRLPDDPRYWFADMKGFLGGAFAPSHPLWMPDPRPGNEVKILLNGQETYWAMVKALDPSPQKWPAGSFIYLANWI